MVTEGAINSLCLQQAFNDTYGGISACPWKFLALSGSGVSTYQAETLRELKEKGYRVIVAPDTDEAGISMFSKLKDANAITHSAFTGDTEQDWNDVSKTLSKKEFAKWFIKQVQKV